MFGSSVSGNEQHLPKEIISDALINPSDSALGDCFAVAHDNHTKTRTHEVH